LSEVLAAIPQADRLVTTVVLGVLLVLGSKLARSAILRSTMSPDSRLRLLPAVRNLAIALFLIGAATIWATELRHLALSVVAILATLAIATKELLMCFIGAFVRTSARMFSVGDRIEVAGARGDVIDVGPIVTTLLEVGPGPNSHMRTGRAVLIPNSLLLTTPVINESFTNDFVLHVLLVPVGVGDDWRRAEKDLLRAAEAECAEFMHEARNYLLRVGPRYGLDSFRLEPRVVVSLKDPDEIELQLRFPAPARKRGQVEQAIIRHYLIEHLHRDATPRTATGAHRRLTDTGAVAGD